MKNTSRLLMPHRRQSGFSLVEMIGVLAIIAILAVIIVPKVFSTIASARVTNAAGSIGALKSATAEFAGRYGTIPVTGANSRIDDLLLTSQFVDGRFLVKIGTQPANPPIAGAVWTYANGAWTAAGGAAQAAQSRVICLASNATAPSTANGANYKLDGVNDLPAGSRVVSAVIVNLTGSEALQLSQKLDGDANSTTAVLADALGKVVYNTPNAGTGLTTAYIYIAHQ
jgi:prepilin-type N-terminal cleavage/methylation domain-containing protein